MLPGGVGAPSGLSRGDNWAKEDLDGIALAEPGSSTSMGLSHGTP